MNPNKRRVLNVLELEMTHSFEHKLVSKTNDPCTR